MVPPAPLFRGAARVAYETRAEDSLGSVRFGNGSLHETRSLRSCGGRRSKPRVLARDSLENLKGERTRESCLLPVVVVEAVDRMPSGAQRTSSTVLLTAGLVTAVVTALSYLLPAEHAATGVGFAFLAATWWLVLRHDDVDIVHHGLALGGLFEPSPLSGSRLVRSAASAAAWGLAAAVLVFPPFLFGFRHYWHVATPFVLHGPTGLGEEVLGQLLVIALPEEAFYRGYLMTALDDAWGTRWKIAGAHLGWGWVASSALFALGHLLTEPNPERLAVFFPALLFGWLRARTGGVGAPALFHAACNLFSATLARSYGMGG